MIPVPPDVQKRFWEYVCQTTPSNANHGASLKWLRYYWDFCQKYHFPHEQQESVPHFLRKLEEKSQTKAQQDQAVQAISWY